MSIFGWSYPPGVTDLPDDEPDLCPICGKEADYKCKCPQCEWCGNVGDPRCEKECGPEEADEADEEILFI